METTLVIGTSRVIALVPARGGSKGLPGKNIKPICGKPLIAWTIEKALKSKYADRIIVSTDDAQIADVARSVGAEVPFLRPADLATDRTPTIDVVRHVLEQLHHDGEAEFHYLVLLEPTSPLRADDDIDIMLETLHGKSDRFDSIVSVGEIGEHPSIVKRLAEDSIVPFCPELQTTTRRQDNEPAYFPFGVAYIAKVNVLLAEGTFYTRRCTYHRIQRYQNYEIDDVYDFLAVESVMRHQWKLA